MLGEESSSGVHVERRSQSHNLIRDLIHTRTSMLALYSKLAAQKPFTELDDPVLELLEEFCEVLVDYTAQAHFSLYRFIEEKMEKRKSVLDIADKVYPRIFDSTQLIVDFNDRYDDFSNTSLVQQLENDLSQLGEVLAERIDLEDQLIAVLTHSRRSNSDEAKTALHS